MNGKILKPPRLRKGQLVGLICPASAPLKPEIIDGAIDYFEQRSHPVRLGANARKQRGYLAGTDQERAADFNAMVRDPEVRAIFAVRGGYGTPRILPLIDYRALKRDPKIVCGFSDITALNCAIWRKTGLVTFSGAMPGVELWKGPHPETESVFWKALGSKAKPGQISNPGGVKLKGEGRGKAEGRLICANLSLLVSLLGTPFMPNLGGAILVVEDVGEEPYRVDRMFVQLRNAGVLDEIAGLVLGTFTSCEPKDPEKPSLTLGEILADVSGWLSVPMLRGLQYGHIPRKLTLPMGVRAGIDAEKQTLAILESGVE